MTTSLIDWDRVLDIDRATFEAQPLFPWINFRGFLTDAGFRRLNDEFPPLTLFERHEGIDRVYGQRPHDRYYLAFESSLYDGKPGEGIVARADLSPAWQALIDELGTGARYRSFAQDLLGVRDFAIRFAWHVAFAGCDVSPHLDGETKLGTHILYFNSSADWKPEWGGSTLVLGGRRGDSMNPELSDFATAIPTDIVDNASFLFRNTPDAWHGVDALRCPEGRYRRLFNVIFEVPPAPRASKPRRKGLARFLPRGLFG
jgi:hypothetical protein